MNRLIRDAKIIDSSSSWNGKRADVRIRKGKIYEIGKGLKKGTETEFIGKDLMLSPGWIDMNVHFRDPGEEYKEDLQSGIKAALRGGFTSVVAVPSTLPVIDSKSGVEYLIQRSKNSGLNIYPYAAMSKGMEGKELAEMFDLHDAGARLFSDDEHSVMNSGLMKKALLYVKNFGGTVCSFPQDPGLSAGSMMNEGALSTMLGMKGNPHITESIQLRRDIDLLRYTESKMHVVGLSTAEGAKMIKEAKKEGLQITAEVFLANLLWTDKQVDGFKTLYKLNPPLRTDKDRKALIQAVNEGTIDCISSNHRPEDVEHKKVEFGQAATGIALMESFYSQYQSHLSNEIPLDRFVLCITNNACRVLNLTAASIEKGRSAILTCFSSSEKADLSPSYSKSYNLPVLKEGMKGKVHWTCR
jgi:dihydroorotase